ncbi:MAG: PAS domain-containing protein [Ignavibacteriales bacterium]|nr:PAS domain-containing protein [Ignavibacteriales bacterium]
MKKIILLFIVVSSLSTNLFAQMHDIKFKRLYEGLSQSSVSCILQDRKGFMWFGTVGGLNRYDGAEFIVYKNVSNDTTSLSANWVLDILESSKGNLWIATADGLNMFDRDKNKFVRYVHKKEDKGSLSHNVVNTILEDSRGNLWVGTDQGGLDMFNKKDNNFIHYRNDNKDRRSLSSNTVYCLYEDRKGNLWIGTRDGQLNLFDRNTRSFTQFKFDNGGASNLNPGRFRKIVEDNQGKFWVGTQDNGLFSIESYSAGHIKYRQYVHDANDVNSLLNNHILSMHLDKTGYLWIGIENGGLEIFNIEKKTLKHYKNDPNDESSISSNSIWSIYQDPIGRIWIGTFDKGLNLIDRYYEKFITYRRQANNRNSLSNENVSKFLEDKHGNLWIATDGGGLNYFNRDKKSFEHFRHNENNKNSLSSDAVLGLYEDKEENLWVGTWAGGIDVLSKDRKTFKHYNTGNGSLLSNNVYTMINDNKGNILIATNSGLNVYDPKKKRFFTYIHNESDENSLSFNAIIQLYRDSKDQIWIGTEGSGLDLMKKDKLGKVSFAHYRNDPTEPSTLSNNIVESIYEDSYHNIWIGTSNGLNLMNRESGTFTIFRKEDGLPDNAIQGILEDNQGTLWLSTLKGLSRFNFKTKTFRNYDVSDGLQGNEFNGRAAMKSRNGEMFFGGRQGFNIVHSESILENPFVPPVYLTDFKIFNKSMNIGTEGSPLKKSIAETKEITLSYTQSVFSFDFAALNYTHPEKNQYAYMMEGFDKEWNYIGIKRTATYTNLDPGEYVFRVKASNNDGIWNEKGASLSIRITPPFWRTYWFYVILFAIIACVIFLFYQSRIRARELAEQRRMDEAIAKERNLLRMVIDNLPDAIYVKDTNCRKTIANVADVNYMGLQSEAEAIGKDDFDVFPKEMAEEFYAGDQSVIQTGNSVFTKEGYVYDKQGQIRWLATTKLPLRDNEGKIIGLVGIGRDITERKLAEEALQKERNLLRTLIDNLPDSIYVKDVNCRKTIANLTEVHYMGLQSEAEAIGKDDFDIYPKELADGFYADDQSVIQTGKAVVNREEYVIDEQGQKRWLATSKLPLRNEKGQTIGLIGIGRDITKRKLAEEALQKERYLLRTLIDMSPMCITWVSNQKRRQ